jgi:hypothetical protein
MKKNHFGAELFLAVIFCMVCRLYAFGLQTNAENATNNNIMNSDIVKESGQIVIGGSGVQLVRLLTKQRSGATHSPLRNQISGLFNASPETFERILRDVIVNGLGAFSVDVPQKKQKVKVVIDSSQSLDGIKDASGSYQMLPKELSDYGERLIISAEFVKEHRITNPEIIERLQWNIWSFIFAVSVFLDGRSKDIRLVPDEDGKLHVFSGTSCLKLRLNKDELPYFNIRKEENFRSGDELDQNMFISKACYFLTTYLKEKQIPKKVIFCNLPQICSFFGKTISEIPGFEETGIFF